MVSLLIRLFLMGVGRNTIVTFFALSNFSLVLHVHECLVTQLCLTICSLRDCRPPGASVYGIVQGRILGWVAISSSRLLVELSS